jgi:hypothetical protein
VNTPARKTAHAHVTQKSKPGKMRSFDETDRHNPIASAIEPALNTKNVEVINAPYGPTAYSLK